MKLPHPEKIRMMMMQPSCPCSNGPRQAMRPLQPVLPLSRKRTHPRALSVAGPWVDADPRRAAEWISELPVSLARDHAIAELIRHFVQAGDLPSATLWADQISDSSLRETLEKQTRPADSPAPPESAPAPSGDAPASEPEPAPQPAADAENPSAPSAQ